MTLGLYFRKFILIVSIVGELNGIGVEGRGQVKEVIMIIQLKGDWNFKQNGGSRNGVEEMV